MINGYVSPDGEIVIRLTVQGPYGHQQRVEAIIDTGFTNWLSLPPDVIARLGLIRRRTGSAILADGSQCLFDVYEATVVWDRRRLLIPVYELDATPLVGMALMGGNELNARIEVGGLVTIRRLRQRRRTP